MIERRHDAALAVLGEPGWRLLLAARRAVDDGAGDALRAAERLRVSCGDAPGAQRAAALELVTSGAALARKIGCDEELLAVREAVEQASSGRVATWHAQQIPEAARVLEIGCGCGGDTLALAHRAANLIATDLDPVRAACAHMNLMTLDLGNARVTPGDGLAALRDEAARADVVFADPDRRRDGRRLRDPAEWLPPLDRLLALAPARRVFIKASSSLDAALVPSDFAVAYVSHAGECVEAFLSSHRAADNPAVRAVLLPSDGPSITLAGARGDAPQRRLGASLHVPDPAAVRSGLLDELCRRHDLGVVTSGVALLTGGSDAASPWLRRYDVVETVAIDATASAIRAALSRHHAQAVRVHVRGIGIPVDQIERAARKATSRAATGGVLDVFVTRLADRPAAVVARRTAGQ